MQYYGWQFEFLLIFDRKQDIKQKNPLTHGQSMVIKLLPCIFCNRYWSVTQAQNCPGWCGTNGDGTSIESNIPTEWENLPAGL
jgi:hypothetical protein